MRIACEEAAFELRGDSGEGCGNRSVFSLKGRYENLEGMRGKSIKIHSFYVNFLNILYNFNF